MHHRLGPVRAGLILQPQLDGRTLQRVAGGIAHHILDAAHKDFTGIEAEYAALLNKRKEQAALMADVLDKRRQAKAAKDELSIRHMDADLGKWLSPEDLKFIDSFGPDTSLRDFANDLGMQNLAIKFLQHRDPTAYAEYRAQRTGVMGRSRAYLRTTSGVAAFGAFSMSFAHSRRFTGEERRFIVTVAHHAAQALDRARLFEALRCPV